jgi:hypothetical protein
MCVLREKIGLGLLRFASTHRSSFWAATSAEILGNTAVGRLRSPARKLERTTMGLDVSIYLPRSDEELLSLRNHWLIFDAICSVGAANGNDRIPDFSIDECVLEHVEAEIEAWWPEVPAQRTFDEAEFDQLMNDGEEDLPAEILKALYRQVIRKLRASLEESSYLICSWSA